MVSKLLNMLYYPRYAQHKPIMNGLIIAILYNLPTLKAKLFLY